MIHLIRPPYKTDSVCPPINLMALAAYVEPHFPVSLSDFVIPYVRDEMSLDAKGMEQAARQLLENPAPVLGFTSMCSSYAAALRIAQECKRQDPDRFILFGGPHASFVDAETLRRFDFVDAIVVGEGEEALVELLFAIKEQRTFHHIQGVTFRERDEIISNPRRPVTEELDRLPIPSFHLIEDVNLYYQNEAERFIEIEAGRGCPFNCNFCSTSLFFARNYRVKSPQRMLEEMRWLKQNWRIDSFGLIHDNLTSRKDKVRALCRHILESGESFKWFCSSRTDTIDRPLMEVMKEAGCQGIFFGVETGSQSMQATMGKRLKIHRVRATFEDMMALGIDATASFIIGFPEETPEMLEETINMALELCIVGVRDVQLHPLSALPGTRVLDEHEERLQFHPHLLSFHDITSVIEITEVEMDWIERYRRIFSNFYAVPPVHYPIEWVYDIRGCYFYLIHFRPYTLYFLNQATNEGHVGIVQQLCRKLPPRFEQWTPEELLRALADVVAELDHDWRSFIQDVLAYEEATTASAQVTDGSNGWVHCKGPAPEEYTVNSLDPTLKPAKVLKLNHDVPAALRAVREGAIPNLSARSVHLVVLFEWDERKIRTLEVDALTAHILGRVQDGESLVETLTQLAAENPLLKSPDERSAWPLSVMRHLSKARLLVDSDLPQALVSAAAERVVIASA